MPYDDLPGKMAKLDARNVRYRFDIETDVPWSQLSASGLHLGPRYCHKLGVDFEGLRRHPEAFNLFQWAAGIEVAEAFEILETYLLEFVDDQHESLGPNRSALLLYQEEVKHAELFRRYAQFLRALKPDWIARFDDKFTGYRPHPYTRDNYPNAVIQHYFFWLKTLVFEEYTVYMHRELEQEEVTLQPVWLAAHEVHAREEKQHVITDAAHLDALAMSRVERRACAHAFWSNFEDTFNEFLGVCTAKALIRDYFPEAASCLSDAPTQDLPIFQDILTDRSFRHTLRHAPYVSRRRPAAQATL